MKVWINLIFTGLKLSHLKTEVEILDRWALSKYAKSIEFHQNSIFVKHGSFPIFSQCHIWKMVKNFHRKLLNARTPCVIRYSCTFCLYSTRNWEVRVRIPPRGNFPEGKKTQKAPKQQCSRLELDGKLNVFVWQEWNMSS